MPRILAHRGQPLGENTIAAFKAALSAGADIIETDIQCTADGVAVIFHDRDLVRMAGIDKQISDLSLSQLRELGLAIPTLEEVLLAFPETKFNIDFKSDASVAAGTATIRKLSAVNRILATAFSAKRIAAVHRELPDLVRSLPPNRVLSMYFFRFLAKPLCKGFVAAQIPARTEHLNLSTKKFIRTLKNQGLEVHYWVINDTAEADRLLALGADGLVTDETARLVAHLRKS
jgi:glycerophosphoryl diester phosphodiesterase